MALESSQTSAIADTSSLDRSTFNVYEQAQRHLVDPVSADQAQQPTESSDNGENELADSPSRLKQFSQKLQSKASAKKERLLHPSREQHAPKDSISVTTLAPAPSNVSDEDRLYKSLPEHKGIQAKDLLHHPVDTVQSALHGASGAKFAAVMDNQVIAHGADVGLVRAYDKLGDAKNEEQKYEAFEEFEAIKKGRQDAYVRWTMDRHVLKVRQDPPRSLEWPQKDDYRTKNKAGNISFRWANYAHQLTRWSAEHYLDLHIENSSSLPKASEAAINTSAERLIMTSMAYQTAIMNIRHIYRWDDVNETAMYMGAYILLLLLGQVSSGMILYMSWLILQRRLYPPTPETIREDIKRSEDITQTASNFSQLIEQHGSRGWIDALIADAGPRALLQLEDAADCLEIIRNFYEWRDPPQTRGILAILAICWVWFTFCPLWIIVRTMQLSFGFVFFGLFPISSHFPQYRHLVSPFRWVFWKIATDAEWAIARLQVEANYITKAMQRGKNGDEGSQGLQDGNTDNAARPLVDIGRFHCTFNDHDRGNLHHGHIIVTSEGVKFETAVRSKTLWELNWNDVPVISKAGVEDGLCFEVSEEEQYKVLTLKERDTLFTNIIGYSGLRWQVAG